MLWIGYRSTIYFYFQKLDNLTRVPWNFILCLLVQYSRIYDDSNTVEQNFLIFRSAELPAALIKSTQMKSHNIKSLHFTSLHLQYSTSLHTASHNFTSHHFKPDQIKSHQTTSHQFQLLQTMSLQITLLRKRKNDLILNSTKKQIRKSQNRQARK